MMTKIHETTAEFKIEVENERNFSRFVFRHSGGTAFDVKIRVGYLKEGIARSGDGMDFGDLSRDVSAVIFDREKIDASTVVADYPGDVSAGRRNIALFMTWRTGGSVRRMMAVGVTGVYEDDLFAWSAPITSDAAIAMLLDIKLMLDSEPIEMQAPVEDSYFTDLTVAGYRGFAEARTLRFAKPTGEPGSGLTVIVGANNSGKSTFLEALQVIARARQQTELSFPQPRRHHSSDAVAIELVRSDDRRLRVETSRVGGSQAARKWLPENASPDKFDIQVTPSRRNFNPYFGSAGLNDRNWALSDQEFSRTQLRDQFVGRLRAVDRDPEARNVFDALLAEIVGYPLEWTIDEIATGQQFLKLIEPDGSWHTSEGLGDGLVSLLFIVDALYDSLPGSLVAIDEPELSLHPQLVRRLGRIFSRYAADRQIVIATHSPLLIDWSDVIAGAAIARVFKTRTKTETRSEIAQATSQTLQEVARLADHRNMANPHTVGAAACEAFFQEDGVILVEGQDEAVYLPRIFDDLGLPRTDKVYGWGSGGVSNMPLLATLLQELGFNKIGALVDNDGQDETNRAFKKLEAMSPVVSARLIPAPDIRYKRASKARPEVVGLLEPDGLHVRPEFRDDAARVISEVLRHVTS